MRRSGCARRRSRPARRVGRCAGGRARCRHPRCRRRPRSARPRAEPDPSAAASQVSRARTAEETKACVGTMPCVASHSPAATADSPAAIGEPTKVVLSGEGLGLAVTKNHQQMRPRDGRIGRRRAHRRTLFTLRLPVMPMAKSGAGDLLVIGGAEDKLGKRTVLKEFVERAGGSEARIAVVPTASSLGPEIIEVYAALFHRLGAAEVYGVRPEDRAQASDPALVADLEPGHRDLHDRRQPAQALDGDRRHRVRSGDRRGARARRHRRRHLGRGQHPVLAHGGVRSRWLHPQAADDAGGRRSRPGRGLRDRPALRPAQPLRPAADDRLAESAAARDGHRRGHRRRDQPHRRTPTS